MKYDFESLHLINSEGVVVKTSDTDTSPWSALKALKGAILTDSAENIQSKVARYELFLKLRESTADTDYTLEDVGHLKRAALTLPTVFAGQLSHFLDQKT